MWLVVGALGMLCEASQDERFSTMPFLVICLKCIILSPFLLFVFSGVFSIFRNVSHCVHVPFSYSEGLMKVAMGFGLLTFPACVGMSDG